MSRLSRLLMASAVEKWRTVMCVPNMPEPAHTLNFAPLARIVTRVAGVAIYLPSSTSSAQSGYASAKFASFST